MSASTGARAALPRALAVVPARLGSQRLARKMLLDATGAPLVVETARNTLAMGVFERVVVATDADEVHAAVRRAGLEAVMTAVAHPSGTDRVREAVERLGAPVWDVVVNVQGDEPELAAGDLAALIAVFGDARVELASLWAPLAEEHAADLSAVKVVLDAAGDALYFSRAPIPAIGHGAQDGAEPRRRHVGVYAYRPAALARFCALAPGRLEVTERLEQLRWLEHGGRIRMVQSRHPTCGIDTARDYAEYVERARMRRGAAGTTSAT